MRIAASGAVTIPGDLTVDTSTLKVDSTNNRVGIGTASPSTTFHIKGNQELVRLESTSATGQNFLQWYDSSDRKGYFGYAASANNNLYITNEESGASILFGTAAVTNMTLDASGNLGLGVTPSAWSSAFGPVVQIKTGSGGGALTGSSTDNFRMFANTFYDGAYKRIGAGYATQYEQAAGAHAWYTAGTSTANSSISFTQAMTLDASGNLGVGTASPTISAAATGIDIYDATDVQFRLHTGVSGTGLSDGFVLSMASDNTVYLYGYENAPMIFATNNNERARITSGGYFKASNTGTYNNATGTFSEISNNGAGSNAVWLTHTSASDPYGPYINFSAAAPDNNTNYFIACVDNVATRMIVYSDGDILNHDGTYGTLPSERRFKQDITDANTQWDDIKNIRLRRYRMISDVETKGEEAPYHLGVIIDELEQVSPGLVIESPVMEKREVTDEDGNVTTEQVQVDTVKGWKTSIVHLKALKALQEAMARIEALEARLEALEA